MYEIIKRLLVECANLREDEISPDAHLREDLGIDSIYAAELTLELEEYFDISINWDEMSDITYVKDVVALVERKVKR